MASLPTLPSMSRFVWQQVLSAFVPGALLLSEVAWALAPSTTQDFLERPLNGAAGVVVLIVFASAAYAVGVPCRVAGFRLLDRNVKALSLGEVVAALEAAFTPPAVKDAMKDAPWIEAAGVASAQRMSGAFIYAKLWLRTHAPASAVDHVEVEVNARAAFLIPLALSALPIGRVILGLEWTSVARTAAVVAFLIGTLALARWLLVRTRRMRNLEPVMTLQHFVAVRLALGAGAPSSGDTSPGNSKDERHGPASGSSDHADPGDDPEP